MITNIEVTKLLQHPDNPRKNIGDVTELAESIKARIRTRQKMTAFQMLSFSFAGAMTKKTHEQK